MKTTPIPVKFDRQGHSCNFFVGFGPTHRTLIHCASAPLRSRPARSREFCAAAPPSGLCARTPPRCASEWRPAALPSEPLPRLPPRCAPERPACENSAPLRSRVARSRELGPPLRPRAARHLRSATLPTGPLPRTPLRCAPERPAWNILCECASLSAPSDGLHDLTALVPMSLQ